MSLVLSFGAASSVSPVMPIKKLSVIRHYRFLLSVLAAVYVPLSLVLAGLVWQLFNQCVVFITFFSNIALSFLCPSIILFAFLTETIYPLHRMFVTLPFSTLSTFDMRTLLVLYIMSPWFATMVVQVKGVKQLNHIWKSNIRFSVQNQTIQVRLPFLLNGCESCTFTTETERRIEVLEYIC